MGQICYSVAMSLDGYIAGPQGEFDWIPMDPDIDFAKLFAPYDTVVMGRRSFEVAQRTPGGMPGMRTFVVSRTLRAEDYPDLTILPDPADGTLARLRTESIKDIWLFGGGVLFRELLTLGLVDRVEVAIVPILLGRGLAMLPTTPVTMAPTPLRLSRHWVYPKSGIVLQEYTVEKRQ